MHIGVERLQRHLSGGREERREIDIEAQIGESGRYNVRTAVMPILPHLGDEYARPSTVPRLEGGSGLRSLLDLIGAVAILCHGHARVSVRLSQLAGRCMGGAALRASEAAARRGLCRAERRVAARWRGGGWWVRAHLVKIVGTRD